MKAKPARTPAAEEDFLANPFEEMDRALAADRRAHPPGKNVFGGKMTEPTPTAWKDFNLPGSKPNAAQRRGRRAKRWEPKPELLAALRARLPKESAAAIARDLGIPVWRIYDLATRGLVVVGNHRQKPISIHPPATPASRRSS